MQRFRRRSGLLFQNMTKIVLEKVVKELKLGIGGHGDRLTNIFGSHKPCYDGQ